MRKGACTLASSSISAFASSLVAARACESPAEVAGTSNSSRASRARLAGVADDAAGLQQRGSAACVDRCQARRGVPLRVRTLAGSRAALQ